jgi:hypothetical protein
LKNISQLDLKNAAPLLDAFVKSQPVGKFSWISELKPIGQKYLDDCHVYFAWKANPGAESPGDVKKHLKTRSAIAEEITGQRRSVSAPVESSPPVESTPPPQPSRTLTQNEIAAAPQKKAQWLAAWKKTLIADLNHKQFSGTFTDTAGAQYTGVTGADDQSLALKMPYGIARLPWAKLAPSTLLTISSSFIQPNAADAADRQWLCAVYASTTNQLEAARQLAEAAANSKSEYRDQLALLGL